jgi:energy-coupling factor transporter ATP-binding protein EcfA2
MLGRVPDDGTLEELPSEGQRASGHDDLHVVLECDRPLAGSTRHCITDLDEVVFRRGRERRFNRESEAGVRRLTLEVPDSHMSSRHATIRRLDGHWLLEDAESRNGSYLLGRRIDRAPLAESSIFQLGHTYFLFRSRELPKMLVEGLPDVVSASTPNPALQTLNHELNALLSQVVAAARAGVAVLLVGEAGSGKDTLARAIHTVAGSRGAFVAVPCVLLGRGTDDAGCAELRAAFGRAAGGTLFLDEIEGLSPLAQMALLPLLKSPSRAAIAQVLSSTRSNEPRPQVAHLSADLLAELASFSMPVPPLRDRLEDLGTLVSAILGRSRPRIDRGSMSMDAAMGRALLLHDWTYNVSELDSCLRSAAARSDDDHLCWSPPRLLAAARVATVRAAQADQFHPVRHPDGSGGDPSTDTPAEPDAEFVQNVRHALKCHLSVAGLQKNGLLRSCMVLEATKGSLAAASTVPTLQKIVLSSLESLGASSPRGDKQRRVLRLTFIEPTATQQEAADRLAMSFGTYRRYVTSALSELVSILWFRELSARLRRETVETARQGDVAVESREMRS